MSISKDRVMQELQRFGGAMYTPVILFAFFGLTVAISIICKNTMLLGSIADKGTVWYDFWFVVEQGAWTVFNQMPILFAIAVPIGFAKKEPARCAKNRLAAQWSPSSSTWCSTTSSPVS